MSARNNVTMPISVVAFDTAYPGSMSQRTEGDYIRRDDTASLAAALLERLEKQARTIEDLEALVARLREDKQ